MPWSLPLAVADVAMVTFPEPRSVESVVAPIPLLVFDADPELIVKLVGSISHVPLLPCGASVVTMVPSAICTSIPEVSTKPPSPPSGALASSVPLTVVLPFSMSERRRIRPALF